MESNIIKTYNSHTNSKYETADQIAMALAIDNEVIQSSVEVTCQVCLGESGSRGQMMVDWRNISFSPLNVTIVTSLNVSKYKSLLIAALS